MRIINYSLVAMMAARTAPDLTVEETSPSNREKEISFLKKWKKKVQAALKTCTS